MKDDTENVTGLDLFFINQFEFYKNILHPKSNGNRLGSLHCQLFQ